MDDLIVFSVFEITRHLRQVVETQIEALYVRGEISNFTHHNSGHMYFNLKDANATLRCTFFRNANLYLKVQPEEGMEVICFGKLTVYEKGGTYNLNVQSLTLAGQGELALRFELLKQKLQEEGLFAAEHKRSLPRYPRRIGIITSPTGAALQDILNILSRRFPLEVDVYPAQVQGEEAPSQLIEGLRYFNTSGAVDVIIIARGGGSQEDLFCFNDEGLARAVFASRIPVVSAVGHEIDFSIADFVADLRAPTPSAAAEQVVPDKADLLVYLESLARQLQDRLAVRLDRGRRQFSELRLSFFRLHPERQWQSYQLRLDMASIELLKSTHRLQASLHSHALRQALSLSHMQSVLREAYLSQGQRTKELGVQLLTHATAGLLERKNRLEKDQLKLQGRSPYAILDQGYSMVLRGKEVISSVTQLHPGEDLELQLKDGGAGIKVRNIKPGQSQHAQK